LKETVRAAGVTSGGLWLYNPSGREWILTGAANMSQNFRKQVETVRGTGTGFDRLARLYKAHVFSRPEEIRLFFPEWEAEGIQSVLGLPLVTGTPGSSEKKLLGVIILADSSPARFDDDRARRLHAAADYVAAVIAEGRLQRQLDSSLQQTEALKAAHERDLEAMREQMRIADARIADERRSWEREMNDRLADAKSELDDARRAHGEQFARVEAEHADAIARITGDRDAVRRDMEAEVTRLRTESLENLTAAQHQVDVVVARLEELRRATDEEKRRMTEESQSRISAERARYDQALAQIRTLEASQQSLTRQLEEMQKLQDGERHSYDRKIEALEAQILRERQSMSAESQRSRDALQQRIAELEMLVAGIEQEHERRVTEIRTQVDEERHHAVDEQRVLKQEIQSLRMALADQQAHFAAERDNLTHEAKQIESRYVQLLEAERDAHVRAREDWEATHEASDQMLLDLKLELENTRFEQGMALARAHNETERMRDEYEERLSSLSDQVMMLEEALMAPPPGLSPGEEMSDDAAAVAPADMRNAASQPATRELHSALLEWVAQQDQDEWHLELSAHDAPHVEMEWLADRLDEARRTCRENGNGDSIGFSIRTDSREDRTTLRMMRLSAALERTESDDETDDMPPPVGNMARWLYDGDDRIGMEITFGSEEQADTEAAHGEPEEAEPHPNSLSVLVVDDQLEMQDIVTDMLASLGHESATSTTAKDAYSRYVNGAFDVVVISADLPQEEGHTLAQWIKSHRVEMPVVMMADAGAGEMFEMVDAVLTKPFVIEQLHECLLTLTDADYSNHVSVSGYEEGSDEL
jgi:CheY-like chemotaxis protein